MTPTLLQYQHPAIKAWQSAYEEYFETRAPAVSKISNRFVIHGKCDSRSLSETELTSRAKSIKRWAAEDRKGMRG